MTLLVALGICICVGAVVGVASRGRGPVGVGLMVACCSGLLPPLLVRDGPPMVTTVAILLIPFFALVFLVGTFVGFLLGRRFSRERRSREDSAASEPRHACEP